MNAPATNAVNIGRDFPKDAVLQRTLSREVSCEGVGVHSGDQISMTLFPAPANSGVVFRRTDVPGGAVIPARWDRVVDTRLCSVLGNEDGVTIGTVEHGIENHRGGPGDSLCNHNRCWIMHWGLGSIEQSPMCFSDMWVRNRAARRSSVPIGPRPPLAAAVRGRSRISSSMTRYAVRMRRS